MGIFKETDKRSVMKVLFCYIMWGILPVFWKLLSGLNSFYVLTSRIIWSAVFCFIIVIATRNMDDLKHTLKDKRQMKYLLCSGVMIAINWGSYIFAISSGHILDASLAYYMNPLMSIALGFLVFGEKLDKLKKLSIFIASAGIMIAIIGYGTIPYYALIIGGSFAIYSVIKKNVTCNGLISTLIEAMFLCPLALVYVVVSENNGNGAAGTLQGLQLLLLPAAGIVTSIPLLAFSSGIRKVPMSLSGILMYVNPTLQMLIGIMLYGETFDLPKKVMFVCVWVALVLFFKSGKANRIKNSQALEA